MLLSYQHNIGGDRINNRLVTIRKHFHMNQQEFGQRLGFAPSTISRWETGERSIPESAVLSICREFGVNEMWFRRGDGEPFRSVSQDDALNELIRTHFLNRPLDFRRELIMALLRFDPDGPEWKVLETIVRSAAALYAEDHRQPEGLPLEGKVSPEGTDEVESAPAGATTEP